MESLGQKRKRLTSADDVTAEATRWVVVLEAGEATAEDRRQFQEWLITHPAHAAAFHSMRRLWRGLDTLSAMDFVELARGEPDVAEEERRMADVQAAPTNERKPDRLLTRAALLFASAPRRSLSFAVAVFFFAMVSAVWFSHSPRWYADHYTAVGEQASVALADDSTVQLNTNTALFVDFSSRTRRVTLHAGEAFFTITPDPVRPFVVQTAGGEVHVLGTAFNVRIDDESVQVSVSTNCVRVTLDDSSAGKEIAAGQRLVYSSTGFWGEVEAVDVSRLTAWRWQRLIFEDQKLIDVVHELIRVTPTKPCERLKKLCRFTADGLLIFS